MKVLVCSPLDTLHTPIVQSSDPEAKYSPFGENTTIFTDEECERPYYTVFHIRDLYLFIIFFYSEF